VRTCQRVRVRVSVNLLNGTIGSVPKILTFLLEMREDGCASIANTLNVC
jgi:hypothetical protein